MTLTQEHLQTSTRDAASDWLEAFAAAADKRDAARAAGLFADEGSWRDILSLTWHLHTFVGRTQIRLAFEDTLETMEPSQFVLSESPAPRWVQRAGVNAIEAFFDFTTRVGRGKGVLRISPDARGQFVATTVMTSLDELAGFEETSGVRRPHGKEYSRNFGGDNWLDQRIASAKYEDRDPAVLVVGGGQAGLAVAARLKQLGVDTLIVDKMERIGDNWRKRYHSLTLHNQVWINHLPYLPFPDTWPIYIPKDKLANWFEFYADSMELNFWTGTELLGAEYDAQARRWNARVRRDQFGERVLHPRHLVIATGISGIPNIPRIPGMETFEGEVLHTAHYSAGPQYKDRNVVVFGTGNSGHDVAQDLHSYGAHVTMVQRSSTTVVAVEPTAQKVYSLYTEPLPTDDLDQIFLSMTHSEVVQTYKTLTKEMAADDQELTDSLNAIGFRTDNGADGTGFQMKYMRRGGGYYINVGCSELLINGSIKLLQYDDIDTVDRAGLQLKDGTHVPVDLMVLATGYKNQQELVRRRLGEDVADAIGPIWGYDERGEIRNVWKRTAQEGLWFHTGSLVQNRIFSKFLALQIKACEVGLLDPAPPKEPRAFTESDT